MIKSTMFALHVTYTCPLACAHCCFRSSPNSKEKLDIKLITKAIAGLDDEVELVAFTGGEPFLLGKDLNKLVAFASERKFRTRVVTSAYFAKTTELARLRISPLVDLGLNEIAISWDDFHEKFVSFDVVKNLVAASLEFKELKIFINIVQARESSWTADRLRKELQEHKNLVIMESPLNMTGRATDELASAGLREVHTLGPCPYIVAGPTVSAHGHLLACCGVIPDTEKLYIAKDFRGDDVRSHIERAKQSPLFQWLYLRGPYSIMEWIGHRHGVPVPHPSDVGGNCEACRRLFEGETFAQYIESALDEMAVPLKNELLLLESLQIAGLAHRMDLWAVR